MRPGMRVVRLCSFGSKGGCVVAVKESHPRPAARQHAMPALASSSAEHTLLCAACWAGGICLPARRDQQQRPAG